MASRAEQHQTTQAAKTTTKLDATPRPGRTPAQVQAEQKALTERGHTKAPPAAPTSTPNVPATAAPQGTVSTEVLERNLAKLGSAPLTPISFDGNTGEFKTPDGPIPAGSLFVAIVPQTRIGFIKFNGPGVQPDVQMHGIAESELLTRDDLPDGYGEAVGPDGQPREAGQEQIVVPLLTTDEAQDMFSFVARNKVSLIAVQNLLGRYRYHPKARDGALPIIQLTSATYMNQKFGVKKPKPVLQLCGWTGADGKSAPPPAAEKVPFNDEVGF